MDYSSSQPSSEDYDSWVDNLGIGASSEGSSAPYQSAAPFTETDFDLDEGFDFQDNSFLDESASTGAQSGAPAFDFGDFNSEEFATIPPEPATAPADTAEQDDFLNVDALFDEDDAAAVGASVDEDVLSYVDEEVLSPAAERTPAPASAAPMDDTDIGELFGQIPAEIEATRLPGTRVGATPLSYVVLVVLVVLNIGAIGLLVMQFVG